MPVRHGVEQTKVPGTGYSLSQLDDGSWTGRDPETGIFSYGICLWEALFILEESIRLYKEAFESRSSTCRLCGCEELMPRTIFRLIEFMTLNGEVVPDVGEKIMKPKVCANCQFYFPAHSECRRYPRTYVRYSYSYTDYDNIAYDIDDASKFPFADVDDWCGEFKEKEDER